MSTPGSGFFLAPPDVETGWNGGAMRMETFRGLSEDKRNCLELVGQLFQEEE